MPSDVYAAVLAGAAGAAALIIGVIRLDKPRSLAKMLTGKLDGPTYTAQHDTSKTHSPNHVEPRDTTAHDWTVQQVRSPQPDWTPHLKQPIPYEGGWLTLDPAELGGPALYPFVISSVVPRPVAFVSTVSSEGVHNLAPFSYFNVMAHDPPYVVIGCCRTRSRPDGKKDTEKNIEETGEFVVSIISEWFVEAANFCCGVFDWDINELTLSNLTPLPSERVKPPRVEESAIHFECKLKHIYHVDNRPGSCTTAIIIGEVVLAHAHEAVCTESKSERAGKGVSVNLDKLKPISRVGGDTYARITQTYDILRPPTKAQEQSPHVRKARESQGA